jgi:hypothetical protein
MVKAKSYWFLVLVAVFFAAQGMAAAQTSESATGTAEEKAAASTPGLADLILKAAELSERFIDLEESLEEAYDPSDTESRFSRVE